MPFSTDIADDFADVFDGIELVTYQSRTPAGGSTPYTNIRALKRATRGSVQGTSLQQTPDHARWHIDATSLTAVTPKRGDRIVSTTGTWEVVSDSTVTLANRYEVETVKR